MNAKDFEGGLTADTQGIIFYMGYPIGQLTATYKTSLGKIYAGIDGKTVDYYDIHIGEITSRWYLGRRSPETLSYAVHNAFRLHRENVITHIKENFDSLGRDKIMEFLEQLK